MLKMNGSEQTANETFNVSNEFIPRHGDGVVGGGGGMPWRG